MSKEIFPTIEPGYDIFKGGESKEFMPKQATDEFWSCDNKWVKVNSIHGVFWPSLIYRRRWALNLSPDVVRVFQVKYIPQSNTKPSRISIKDSNKGVTKVISYHDDALSAGRHVDEKAIIFLHSLGIRIISEAQSSDDSYILITNDLNTPIK